MPLPREPRHERDQDMARRHGDHARTRTPLQVRRGVRETTVERLVAPKALLFRVYP